MAYPTLPTNLSRTGPRPWADMNAADDVINQHSADLTAQAGALFASVKTHGATGNGTTDDTPAINATIAGNPGRTIFLPNNAAGTAVYRINPLFGIKLNQPGTRLLLDPGVTIKVPTNSELSYVAIEVLAADCVIEGGTILGDGPAHTGTAGEWGHLISITANAHRCRVVNTTVRNAWGDGIAVSGNPFDVQLAGVVADDNRRQGLSLISCTRLSVIGGIYKNTGLTKYTGPGAGIDLEPNPGSGLSVTDVTLTGVLMSGNKGAGFLAVGATGVVTTFTASGCRSVGNGAGATNAGFYVTGGVGQVTGKLTGCHAIGNSQAGFWIAAPGVDVASCHAAGNTTHGFRIDAAETKLLDPISKDNKQHGIQFNTGSDRSTLAGGESSGNSQATNGAYVNVDFQATAGIIVAAHVTDAGTNPNKPAWGFFIRTGATPRLLGCDARGAFTAGMYSDIPGTTVILPAPGATTSGTPPPQIDVITVTGLWIKPAGAKAIEVIAAGGGGGGGSGRRGAVGSIRVGGGGGGGGGFTRARLDAADVAGSLTVSVGVLGAGGAAITADDTNGNTGGNGGATTFGVYAAATGGSGGVGGGLATLGTGGAGGIGTATSGNGGSAPTTGIAGGGSLASGGPAGAGAGGGITAGNVAFAGGNGRTAVSTSSAFYAGGVVDATPAANAVAPVPKGQPGGGGGGGAASVTAAAQPGGNGAGPGGSGGGGGASVNGNASGAGGNGATGYCLVITTF